MRDDERKDIIKGIKGIVEEKKSLKDKYKELKKLTNAQVVKQYLQLLNDIDSLENKLKYFDSLEKIINWEFSAVLHRDRPDIRLIPCKHDIWLYDGSYFLSKDPLYEHDYIIKEYCETTTSKYGGYPFMYNRYICLECGKKVETKDWKNFEGFHFVLKNQNKDTDLGSDYYINRYYQLLYRNSVKKSQETIIKEFEEQKVLKK